jgi:hypothetical protein
VVDVQKHLIPLNETVEGVTLHLDLQHISQMWWTLQLGLRQQMAFQEKAGFAQVHALELCSVLS